MTDRQIRKAMKRIDAGEKLKDIAYEHEAHSLTLTRNINRIKTEIVF